MLEGERDGRLDEGEMGPSDAGEETRLRPQVMSVGTPPPDRGSRLRMTPATVLALLLLVISSFGSLLFVLGRGGMALPSTAPTLPVVAAASPTVGATVPAPSDAASSAPSDAPDGSPAGSSAPSVPSAPPTVAPPRRFGEDDPEIAYEGSWGRASAAEYAGGSVAWTTEPGATALLVFSGRTITWLGPTGPTRGSAVVYLDGAEVATVSQYASTFTARRSLFTHAFTSDGSHTIRIVAVGTAGHPMVAIDELIVGHEPG